VTALTGSVQLIAAACVCSGTDRRRHALLTWQSSQSKWSYEMKLPAFLHPEDMKKTFISFVITLAVQAVIVLLAVIAHL
jgi:hypothetical protein